MNHVAKMDNLTRNTRRREFDDGMMDFVFGGTSFFLGLLGWFFFSSIGLRWYLTSLIQNREITIIAFITLIPLITLIIFGARQLIGRIRRKTLWKNQGSIEPLTWQIGWQINTVAGAVFVSMIIIAVILMENGSVSQEIVLRTLVSSTGVATSIVFFGIGKELDLQRYKWVGTSGGILSAVIILLPISFSISWLMLGFVWMIVLTVSGLWALRKSVVVKGKQDSE